MLPNTEERDVDQILMKRIKKRTKDKGSLKVVMVDQLWLWLFDGMLGSQRFCRILDNQMLILLPCLDVLITSFPQTWGQDTNEGKNFDLLTDLIEYIRGPRAEPFLSAHDLASTIVKRCSNVFTSDAKLLSPDPLLSEIYQEAIGVVVCTQFLNCFGING
jgi:hypothetical protein